MTEQAALPLGPGENQVQHAGPLSRDQLRVELKEMQRATIEQMLDYGPDPARLALMAEVSATLEAVEEEEREDHAD